MAIATQKTAAETAYLDAFAAGDDWLAGEREKGFAAFTATGLPHRRMEDWKWTDLRQLIGKAFPPVRGGASGDIDALVASSPLKDIARARLVFVNGEFDAARSQMPASGDVAVTALAHMGLGPDPAWNLDGHVRGLKKQGPER